MLPGGGDGHDGVGGGADGHTGDDDIDFAEWIRDFVDLPDDSSTMNLAEMRSTLANMLPKSPDSPKEVVVPLEVVTPAQIESTKTHDAAQAAVSPLRYANNTPGCGICGKHDTCSTYMLHGRRIRKRKQLDD